MGDDVAEPTYVDDQWPLTGRDQALRTILSTATTATTGGVVVVGERGIGKSRLARDAVATLCTAGHPTAWAAATRAGAGTSFGALSHLIPHTDVPTGRSDRLDLHLMLLDRFRDWAGQRPVLGIDNAHLLDDASAALVHHLAAHRTAFVVATVTAGAQAPDAVTALWKDRVARRVEVAPLTHSAVDALLETALGGPLDPVSQGRLRRLVAGNPLLLRELVTAGRQTGALRVTDGIWTWTGGFPATRRLAEIVDEHMGPPDPAVRVALETIAFAEPLAQDLVDRVVDPAATLEAERRGLITIERVALRTRVRLAVPAHAEVIRAGLPRLRARAISRQLADAFAQSPHRSTDDAVDHCWWRLHGDLPVDPRELIDAARRALCRLDFPRAERLAEVARQSGGGADADLTLARVLSAQGRHREALAVLRSADAGTDPVTLDRLDAARQAAAHWTSAGQQLPADWTGRTDDPVAQVTALVVMVLGGHADKAVSAASDLLACGRLSPAATVSAAATATFAAGLLDLGATSEQFATTGTAAALVASGEPPYGLAQLERARCAAAVLTGSLRLAAELAEAGHQAAVRREAGALVGTWTALRGIVASAQGRLPEARSALREAVAALTLGDPCRLRRVCLGELAAVYAMAGQPGPARSWLARMDRVEPAAGGLYDAWTERHRAWVAASSQDSTAGVEHALRAAALARAAGQPAVEALALFDAARLGAPARTRPRLDQIAASTDGAGTRVLAETVTALDRGDGTLLDAAVPALRRHGYLLPAAEVATAAYRAHRCTGRRSAGYGSMGVAQDLLRECGDAATPLLCITDVPHQLTRREFQIARLAADGHSGPVIASRLGLSLRTVNNHLTRAYAKLGVPGRQGLADFFGARVHTADTIRDGR